MRNNFKRILLIIAVVLIFNCLSLSAIAYDTTIWGTNVNSPTQEQISAMFFKFNLDKSFEFSYSEMPSTTYPYVLGTPSNATYNRAINSLNFVRYISGLGYDVKLVHEYTSLAQSAVLLNAVNHSLSHTPPLPYGFPEDIADLGITGSSKSNLALNKSSGEWHSGIARDPYYDVVHLWMSDDDSRNFSNVPHRRWFLNPTLEYSGYGVIEIFSPRYESYRSMHSHDGALEDTNITGVAWPAQNMPLQAFGSNYPWSFSVGRDVNSSNLKVTLTRINDGKVWEFSKYNGSTLHVDNTYYGQNGCIIFNPGNIDYNAGDSFNVRISGDVSANYFVDFFDVYQQYSSNMTDAQLVPDGTAQNYIPPEINENLTDVTIANNETPLSSMPNNVTVEPSTWALESIEQATELKLLDGINDLEGNYQKDITRAEFCNIVVRYFEAMGGKMPKSTPEMPFIDTNDEYIATAYDLGIVNGISETEFSPDTKITREQMAVMMCNANDALDISEKTTSKLDTYDDCNDVSDWAWDSLDFLNSLDIIRGYSDKIIAPLDETTREQAVVIIMRAIEIFS